ncbi:orn/DAP/Arg family decarboxylase [Nitzschia inconspicua]|uniref:Orn/DAP/Arg family decarboxylase n=1 Tax=Nitzschia inconspicua TaxID=303405 RepID=A0A9K3KBJ1_9STRA|nr:orn/DAP/Arg family decarboxylase [Nitzschia inconspicua]
MGRHGRSLSFHEIDHEQASGILSDVLKEADVYLGGSSIGKGLKKAASYYLSERSVNQKPPHLSLPGAKDLALVEEEQTPTEEAFYVVDLGVVVSQVYQWRRFFPRIDCFYAVKCNPDPIIIKTLAILGCNFDCASRNEIRLVQEITKDLPGRTPDIIYANPCKARAHLIEAVCRGVRMVTFDNVTEVEKCAAVSKKIELILRIITDDRGSQCRLSSKFGAPRYKWRPLLAAAKRCGLNVVGVSFHVGSGCRDASRYELALKDAREIFDIAESEFGMHMKILDVGGGFPGETHSIWNPAVEIDEDDTNSDEGKSEDEESEGDRFMFFKEIAEQVAPIIDRLFPVETGVRVIGEPGRYFVAAAATLCTSIVAIRNNAVDSSFSPEPIMDSEAAAALDEMTREEEKALVQHHRRDSSVGGINNVMDNDQLFQSITETMEDYSKLFASQQLAQQEIDVYTDNLDLYKEGFESALDQLGPPDAEQMKSTLHTVEGMTYSLVAEAAANSDDEAQQEPSALLTLAAAGEAAVSGVMFQAVADSAPLQDDYAYYINDGVYGAFNNIMFDHATVRPRVLRVSADVPDVKTERGFKRLDSDSDCSSENNNEDRKLFASTVFGPTCDSIDVVARSVLLPKLKVGDFLYMNNMGAYTMAAASSFNGFVPTDKFYVCSVQPEYFEEMIKGPEFVQEREEAEEKKEHD